MGATERVKEYIDFKGITKYQFCKNLGFSNKFLDNSSNMGTDKACKILQYYRDINPQWLLTGEGSMIKKTSEGHIQQAAEPISDYGSKEKDDPWIVMIESKDKELRRCHEEIGRLKEIVRRLQKNNPTIKDVSKSD